MNRVSRVSNCLLSAVLAIVLTGCESVRTLSVAENSLTPAIYEGGNPVLTSVKLNTVVVRLLTPRFSDETNSLPAFVVIVRNDGTSPIDFSTENIMVRSSSGSVKVFTYEEMDKRIKHENAMLALAVAMNGASQSMAASMPQQSYTTGTASAYGAGGYAHANYSSVTSTYNPAATAAAQAQINAQTQSQMAMIADARNAQLQGITSMLRRETILPSAYRGGVIKLHSESIKSGQQLIMSVDVAGEVHDFAFEVGR